MSRGKILKKTYRSILYWSVCALIVITLVAFAISEVYAKYVTSGGLNDSANVAGVGVEVFELVGHGDHGTEDTFVAEWNNTGRKYECNLLIPGVDIPGPHVKLKINSDVSYTLYIKVKVPKNVGCLSFVNAVDQPLPDDEEVDDKEEKTVFLKMNRHWVEERAYREKSDDYIVYTFKYSLTDAATVPDYVFKAGVEYVHDTDETEIEILNDDRIYVSDKFDYSAFKHETVNAVDFTLSFEAYIRQVIA